MRYWWDATAASMLHEHQAYAKWNNNIDVLSGMLETLRKLELWDVR